MRWWKNFINSIALRKSDRYFQGRKWLEERDTFRVCLISKMYQDRIDVELSDEEAEKYIESLGRDYITHKKIALDHLHRECNKLLSVAHSIGGRDPYPRPIGAESDDIAEENHWKSSLAQKRAEALTNEQKVKDEEIVDKPIEHPDGFTLKITKSTIDHPSAGFGVKIIGSVLPGSLIGFYPGRVYFPEELKEDVVKNNEYLIARYDGAVIDGREWHKEALMLRMQKRHALFSGLAKPGQHLEAELLKYRNPFAIANYINHPPPGKLPNVLCYAYDFLPDIVDENQRNFIPNRYHKPPSFLFRTGNEIMRGMACIALTHIKDEELFLNYRFNPANPFPDWYCDPDPETSRQRWGKWNLV